MKSLFSESNSYINGPLNSNGRLTLTSGTPVTTSDVTAATTLYFTPYMGNRIDLFNGTIWQTYAFSELSLSLSGYTAASNYDIFLYDNAGTLTLEGVIWTNSTTRATGITLQNGIYVKSGSTSRRYLGTIRTVATGQTEDTQRRRFVFNANNQVQRSWIGPIISAWTYSTQTWRQAAADATMQIECVAGLNQAVCGRVEITQVYNSTTNWRTVYIAAGLNSITSPNFVAVGAVNGTANINLAVGCEFSTLISPGYNYIAHLEYGGGADTQTWQPSSRNTILAVITN